MKLIRDKSGSAELPTASAKTATVQSIEFAEFTHPVPVDAASALGTHATETRSHPLHGVRTRLTVSVGSIEMTVGELLAAKHEQVLRLDQRVDQPVDLLIEGRIVARGTLVAVGEHFGVQITELPQALAL